MAKLSAASVSSQTSTRRALLPAGTRWTTCGGAAPASPDGCSHSRLSGSSTTRDSPFRLVTGGPPSSGLFDWSRLAPCVRRYAPGEQEHLHDSAGGEHLHHGAGR